MATYMIGYDLQNASWHKYEELFDAIKAYGTWWHHLDSTWLIVTNDTAVQIRDNLKQHLRAGDELLVAIIALPAAWYGFNDKGSQWLKDNL